MKVTALPEEQKLELIKRYQAGESSEAIAPDFGLTGAGVRWILKEKGIPVRDKLTAGKIRRRKQLLSSPPDDGSGAVDDLSKQTSPDAASLPPAPPSRSVASREAKTVVANSLGEANIVAFVPKRFEISSILLNVAQAAVEREWEWPRMSPGDFLDTYLFLTLRQRGILVASYTVLDKKVKE